MRQKYKLNQTGYRYSKHIRIFKIKHTLYAHINVLRLKLSLLYLYTYTSDKKKTYSLQTAVLKICVVLWMFW